MALLTPARLGIDRRLVLRGPITAAVGRRWPQWTSFPHDCSGIILVEVCVPWTDIRAKLQWMLGRYHNLLIFHEEEFWNASQVLTFDYIVLIPNIIKYSQVLIDIVMYLTFMKPNLEC